MPRSTFHVLRPTSYVICYVQTTTVAPTPALHIAPGFRPVVETVAPPCGVARGIADVDIGAMGVFSVGENEGTIPVEDTAVEAGAAVVAALDRHW